MLIFKQITLSEEKNSEHIGTYAGYKLEPNSARRLLEFCRKKLPQNVILPKEDDLHCTLLYSRKHLPNYKPARYLRHYAKVLRYEVFGDPNEEKGCLVAVISCQSIIDRHKFLMKEHGGTYDYNNYIPHITIAYDFPKSTDLSILEVYQEKIELGNEYVEKLDFDWIDKNKVK